ncbi:hypothetical protein D4L84_09175, partial [Campylobacter coli]
SIPKLTCCIGIGNHKIDIFHIICSTISIIIDKINSTTILIFNAKGQGLNLRDGQGIWVSYADATYSTNKVGVNAFDPNLQQ